ncbi:hypothetical protein ABZS61_19465 [Streptomyces sp. NPDC005566]|uniref:hypothetical protein n=1 Tax=Streptomyces sp. NPDC005566 TaxID=3156886 RepID=UPI0033B5DB09
MRPYQPSADRQYENPDDRQRLPSTPGCVESLTHQGYGFEAAAADLADNSIDAGARNVVISFLRDEDRLVIDAGSDKDDEAHSTPP